MAGRGASPEFGEVYRRRDGLTVMAICPGGSGNDTDEGFPADREEWVTLTLAHGDYDGPHWPLHGTAASMLASGGWEKVE